MHTRLLTAQLILACTLLACGPVPTAKGPHFQGDPLFSIAGQLSSRSVTLERPIRLAVAWYPSFTANSHPEAIVTEDIAYTGSFPLNYRFTLYTPPPAQALTRDFEGAFHHTNVAWGVLLAYDDRNDNGALDAMPDDLAPVDHVLGTSFGDFYNGQPAPTLFGVLYIDGDVPAGLSGYHPGYNLLANGRPVSADTAVPIELTGTNENDLFLCSAFINSDVVDYDLPCHIAPTDGVRVIGNITASQQGNAARIRVTDGTHALSQARVTVNGTLLSFLPNEGYFWGSAGLHLEAPGRNTVRVEVADRAARVFSLELPGAPTLTAPADSQRVLTTTPLSVSWAPGANAVGSSLYLNRTLDGASERELLSLAPSQTSAQLSDVPANEYLVSIYQSTADTPARGAGGSWVSGFSFDQRYVMVVPEGLQAMFNVLYEHQGVQVWGEAIMMAYDGATPLTNAQMTVNGLTALYTPQYQSYVVQDSNDIRPGVPAVIRTTANGVTVEDRIDVPGDFELLDPPEQLTAGQPLPLRWSASSGAKDYALSISNSAQQVVYNDQLPGLNTTIAFSFTPGRYLITLAAQSAGTSAGRLAQVVWYAEFTVTP